MSNPKAVRLIEEMLQNLESCDSYDDIMKTNLEIQTVIGAFLAIDELSFVMYEKYCYQLRTKKTKAINALTSI